MRGIHIYIGNIRVALSFVYQGQKSCVFILLLEIKQQIQYVCQLLTGAYKRSPD